MSKRKRYSAGMRSHDTDRLRRDMDWLFDKPAEVRRGIDPTIAYDMPDLRLDINADLDWYSIKGVRVA